MKLTFILVSFLFTYFATAEKIHQEDKVSCKVIPLKEKYKLGEQPRFILKIRNNSHKKITLVKLLDGSECGFRQPQGSFQVFGPDGKAVHYIRARCGNTNIIRKSDFFTIDSGKEFLVANGSLSLASGFFKKPGIYKIKFNYSTINDDFHQWSGGPLAGEGFEKVKKECADLFKNREKVLLTSEIELEILPKS